MFYYDLEHDEDFEPGDEALEVGGTNWFPITDSIGSNLSRKPAWQAARRPDLWANIKRVLAPAHVEAVDKIWTAIGTESKIKAFAIWILTK